MYACFEEFVNPKMEKRVKKEGTKFKERGLKATDLIDLFRFCPSIFPRERKNCF